MNINSSKKGITLISLIVTIIVLLILAGITVAEGTLLIRKAKIESIMTNMITIKSKAKVLVEEANSKVWALEDERKIEEVNRIFVEDYIMETTTISSTQIGELNSEDFENTENIVCYKLTDEALNIIGFTEVENCSDYIIVINKNNFDKLEIIYNPGIKYQNETIYSLSYMQLKLEE